jgi:hypothetical protein
MSGQKVGEILSDPSNARTKLELSRRCVHCRIVPCLARDFTVTPRFREAEFGGQTKVLFDPMYDGAFANLEKLSLYGNKLQRFAL